MIAKTLKTDLKLIQLMQVFLWSSHTPWHIQAHTDAHIHSCPQNTWIKCNKMLRAWTVDPIFKNEATSEQASLKFWKVANTSHSLPPPLLWACKFTCTDTAMKQWCKQADVLSNFDNDLFVWERILLCSPGWLHICCDPQTLPSKFWDLGKSY